MEERLARLAESCGVATSYVAASGQRTMVDSAVVTAVLAELGVDPGSDVAVSPGAGTVVGRPGEPSPVGAPGVLITEDGRELSVNDILPPDLPTGYHRFTADDREIAVIVPPSRLPTRPPVWGWMVQLYALHSEQSWGIGDLADLRRFAGWSADELGAGAVLLNPLHAITPTLPVRRSPYSPSSRSFANPLSLSIPDIPEFARVDPATRQQIESLRPPSAPLIDYDAVWMAKRKALELLWPYAQFNLPADPRLREYATFCALAEIHGPDWRRWPSALRDPRGSAVAAAGRQLAERIAFHGWLQGLCDMQMAAARKNGPAMIHDLPVGVTPDGADAWALQDVLAPRIRVGAPPDPFNQQGQDWDLPPWRPDRLAATGYTPWRDMLARAFSSADGLRIDHVAGLWRLWWIPPNEPPDRGTYVSYDADAMLAVLAIEASRAGGWVIGEDLGTVRQAMTDALHDRGMATSAVLWFSGDPRGWPENAMGSISTHDLPTAAGFLAGEQVRVRAELGILDRPVAEEQRQADADRQRLLDRLHAEGLAEPGAGADDLLVALHALLAAAPSRLLLAALTDVLGEIRQPNMPGTLDEYPNWRIPLPLTLEQLMSDDRLRRCIAPLQQR